MGEAVERGVALQLGAWRDPGEGSGLGERFDTDYGRLAKMEHANKKRRGRRRMELITFNGNLSWRRRRDLRLNDGVDSLRNMKIPVVMGQGDLSPPGGDGRVCLAMTRFAGEAWMVAVSVYSWTGESLGRALNWLQQLAESWARVLRDHQLWAWSGTRRNFVWVSLHALADSPMLLVGQSQAWFMGTAGQFGRLLVHQREAAFREKLSDRCPGSDGFLHRICKWRSAWQEASSPTAKQTVAGDPPQAVEAEGLAWQQVWRFEQRGETPPWRSWNRAPPERRLETEQVCAFCKACRKHAGIGGDMWHPCHWAWLSEAGAACMCSSSEAAERVGRWSRQVRFLILFILAEEGGGGRLTALQATLQRVWGEVRNPEMRNGLALEAFHVLRVLRLSGAFSEIIATINDVPAGGKYANRFMKIVALLPLDWVQAAWPRMREVPFVDDTKLRLIGKQRQIRKLSQRPQALIDCLERGMQLEASRGSEGVEGKSGYLCSTPEASEALADDMELLGLGHCEAKRWLGVDYQPAARYNSQGTRRASARKKRGVCVEGHGYAVLVQLVVSRIVPAGSESFAWLPTAEHCGSAWSLGFPCRGSRQQLPGVVRISWSVVLAELPGAVRSSSWSVAPVPEQEVLRYWCGAGACRGLPSGTC